MAKRILVVEDNAPLRRVIERGLKSNGYETAAVEGPTDALLALATGDFDLVVTDYDMGAYLDGVELARRIKDEHAGIPVILFTGSKIASDIPNAIVGKPDIEALMRVVGEFLARPRAPR